MDERGNYQESFRIEQLEHERDELRKDIEQLCLQQAGPSYLAVATRMHFQRTTGLEQEIESLKKKLAGCTRDNQNLQEELSEAYQIKSQLADLHSTEVLKNKEAEKQVKFFQGCVAAAFAERDHSLMEYEKAKEREEAVLQKLIDFENRVEDLQLAYIDEQKLTASLQMELNTLKEQNESFEKVISKFCEIRERATGYSAYNTWHDKCSCLLDEPSGMWTFNGDSETSTSKYITSLEEELETLRNSMDNLQNNLRMGLEIEQHLKRKVQSLDKKQIILGDMIGKGLSALHDFHDQQRLEIMNILEEETTMMKSMLVEVQDKMRQIHMNRELQSEALQRDAVSDETECRDVHITGDADSSVVAKRSCLSLTSIVADGMPNASDALAQALQEKVSALLLLSQQEERHLLERDVNGALQKKIEELQRNLYQATDEKVKVLMELAQLRREFQLLQENNGCGMKQGICLADGYDKSISAHERDGKLKNLLKRTYLKRWIGRDFSEHETDFHGSIDESSSTNKKSSSSIDFARLKVENASLQESMVNMEYLTSSIHRLRLSLVKAQDAATLAGPSESIIEALDSIIIEANNMKTALGSSLPVSWSADAADPGPYDENFPKPTEKVDTVSAAGFEMVELLILAAQLQKEILIGSSSSSYRSN